MDSFFRQLAAIGAMRLVLMFGLAAGVAGALMFVGMGTGNGRTAFLYSSADLADVAEMSSRLGQAGMPFDLTAGGSVIMVPRERVIEARLLLAQDGLPNSANMGYEIFDNQSGLGATQFVQNINKIRALEGEVARTLEGLQIVASARVHLAIPERKVFERDAEAPSASVVLEVRGDLSRTQARAIRNIVASAIEGLNPSRVTIMDSDGRLLFDGSGEGEDAAVDAMDDRRVQIETRIRNRVSELLTPLVGRDAVEVQVSAEIDTTRITETAEMFDPEGQVIRSVQTEQIRGDESSNEANDSVSITENIPETDANANAAGTRRQNTTSQSREQTNFDISQTVRTQIRLPGEITRLSVAVVIDDVRITDEEGAITFTNRDPELMQRIESLVRSAVGFTEARGDTVTVVNARFAETIAPTFGAEAPPPMQFDKNDILRIVELSVLAIVAILVLLLVARPLVSAATGGQTAGTTGGSSGSLAGALTALPGMSGDAADGDPGATAMLMSPEDAANATANFAKVDGEISQKTVDQVTSIVSQNPDKSLQILRDWLHDSDSPEAAT